MAAPMLPLLRKGNMANMVVSEVIMMGRRRRWPASMMARRSPPLEGTFMCRLWLMVSIFRIESLMTIPLMTTMPVIDIRLIVSPMIHRATSTKNTSTTISSRMMSGCTRLSNWAARMK